MGVFFVIVAILAWGIGDFLIQRSTRKFGDWEALFFICAVGSIMLAPFSYEPFMALTPYGWFLLTLTSFVILFAALFDLEALRVGKISVVEPVYAMEVPLTVVIAAVIVGEYLRFDQLVWIGVLLAGIYLVANKKISGFSRGRLERGVLLAVIATVAMSAANFLFGFGSRELESPLLVNWFTCLFMTIAALLYLIYTKQTGKIVTHFKHNKTLILSVGVIDNIAWVAFASSMLYMPIGIATGLSEMYIAIAALLGLFLNREKLRLHQIVGLVVATIAAIVLSLIS